MRTAKFLVGIIVVASLVTGHAQTQPQTQTPKPRPKPRPAVTHVIVRDVSGNPLSDVNVTVSGAAKSQATTGRDGATDLPLAPGTYRLRFDRDGYRSLEREVVVRAGQGDDVEVALGIAPTPPAAPPPPAPRPAPAPSAPPPPVTSAAAAGPPVMLSLPTFIDKNYIGRDPLKESVLACTPNATTRLLQLREPISLHKHADLDEMLYIVAGEGAIRIGDEPTVVGPGHLSVIPRGVPHAIERRGKNPLIVLSLLAGAPCPPTVTAITSSEK